MLASAPAARAAGKWDSWLDGSISYPFGGGVSLWGGYGWFLWGKKSEGPDTNWKYGYIRPNGRFFTAGLVNRAEIRLDFFPVSIFGFTIGQGASQRWVPNNSSDYDCDKINCKGFVGRTFIENKMKIGAGIWGMQTVLRADFLNPSRQGIEFLDDVEGIAGSGNGDWLLNVSVLTGIKLSETWKIGVNYDYYWMTRAAEWKRNFGVIATKTFSKEWRGTAALSMPETTRFGYRPTVTIGATWTFAESPEL